MARKSVTKRTSNPPLAILTPSEQRQLNEDWKIINPGTKLDKDVQVTLDYYKEWGGKGSSVSTNEKRGGWTRSGFAVDYPSDKKEVGKLPIRKINSSVPKSTIQKSKQTVPVEIKYKKEPKVKAMSKGGKPLQRLATNAKATAKNIVGPAKFKREEKLASAYEKNKAGLNQMSYKEKVADLKERKKYLRSSEMKKTEGMDRKTLNTAKKGLRQAEKYVKKESKGKIKYFTQAALGKTMEVTDKQSKTKPKKIQAGKVRFS